MNENKNLLLALALSVAIYVGFDYFFGISQNHMNTPTQETSQTAHIETPVKAEAQDLAVVSLEKALKKNEKRFKINHDKVHGSINAVGGRIDDLTLAQYHETPNAQSAEVTLLNPANSPDGYFVDFNWAASNTNQQMPNQTTNWNFQKNQDQVEPQKPITLTWENNTGLRFERTITLDENYMFKVKDKVINNSKDPLNIISEAHIVRQGTPKTSGYYILHEGPVGIVKGKLEELSYDKIKDEKRIQSETKGGWIGVSDKYWLVALIQNPEDSSIAHFSYNEGTSQLPTYDTSLKSLTKLVNPGESYTVTRHVYTGPKKLKLLEHYEKTINADRLNLAIDFGWLWFITKPTFQLLEMFHKILGNFGLSILALTVLFKLLLFPLANKSYRSMSRMKKFQPKLEALKERYGDDKLRLNQEMLTLYKKENINPVSGCLPMVVQAPILFSLYKVFFVTIEMRHAPFLGWIQDLSAPDPTSLFTLFGLLPITLPSFLHVGIWPIIMGLTMFLQQRLNPQPADPTQAKMFMMMPIVLTFVLAQFPAGLVIYWAWSNILTIAQQWTIMYMDRKSSEQAVLMAPASKNKNVKK